MNSVHLKLRPYKCHLCPKSCALKSNLAKHIEQVHLNVKKHWCELCNMAFYAKWNLKLHLKGVHSDTKSKPICSKRDLKVKPYKCNFCPKSCALKSNMAKHIEQVHLNVKKHWCEICNMGFYAKGDFKRHFDGKNCKKNAISKTISKQKREREDVKEHVDEKYLKMKRPKRIMPTRSVKSFENKRALKHQANKIHFELKGHDQKYQFHRHVNKKYAKVKSPGVDIFFSNFLSFHLKSCNFSLYQMVHSVPRCL